MHSSEEVLVKKTILVVDDDVRNTFAVVSYLEIYEMNILTAESGLDALEKLQQHPGIDMVLMDIMMPGMDGYEAMRRIRRNTHTANLPVIAVTAQAMKGDREKCFEAGASEYVSKPIDLKELIEKMVLFIEKK